MSVFVALVLAVIFVRFWKTVTAFAVVVLLALVILGLGTALEQHPPSGWGVPSGEPTASGGPAPADLESWDTELG
jgi:hypothetical protein